MIVSVSVDVVEDTHERLSHPLALDLTDSTFVLDDSVQQSPFLQG